MSGTAEMSAVFVSALAGIGKVVVYLAMFGVPFIVIGFIAAQAMIYKYKVVINEGTRTIFTSAKISKNGQMTLKKPKYKVETYNTDLCTIDNRGNYVFYFWKENNNSYRQLKPDFIGKKGDKLTFVAEDKGIDFLVEEWKKQQKEIFTLEGFEKIKDLVFLGFIIVFNIVSMGMLLNAAGLN